MQNFDLGGHGTIGAVDSSESGEKHASARSRRWLALLGGGPEGNEQLTTLTGAILIVLLGVIGITILRIGQLLWLHLFVGLVLLGPVAVKMGSTGYRFVRYYTWNPNYRAKGPPERVMRLTAPVLVASTVVVFASGSLLLFAGPGGRGQFLSLHKASFIIWLPFTGLHILGHLPAIERSLRRRGDVLRAPAAGMPGRLVVLLGGLLVGVVVALALVPEFSPWTAHTAFLHADH